MSDIFIDSDGHVIRNTMTDEHTIVEITEKIPNAKNIGKIICGETNSNIITFEMNRYYDNVDLITKNIKFIVKTPSFTFEDYASNVQHNSNLIRFSWMIPYSATQESGNVNVAIEFFDNAYSLKTMPFDIKVEKSINTDDMQVEVPTNWFIDIESRVLQLENKTNTNIQSAVEEYLNENPAQAVSDEHIKEVASANYNNNDDFNNAVNAYLKSQDKLARKTIVCAGDSLMAGNGWTGGYANCIRENHPEANIVNVAVTGAKLIHGEIFDQITAYHTVGNNPTPDIIIFDGGGNDFVNRSTIGTGLLDSSYIAGTSDTTCDALETMINAVKTVYPFAKLLYISTPPMHQWDEGDVVPGVPTPKVQREYLDAIEKVLNKWSVPMADIYRNGNVTSMNASQLGEFFMSGDTIHLNEAGYRQVSPVIEDALKKLL